ncbi:cytochrome c [Mesorhizobium sp. CN5-321]|jgi:mono/diheme cytochrome c family protein|uniref:SorB family sulfite dehydrogenase c-type cytochrome subunit n=1 Tax=Mesorhizobium hunchu TaxID=3157708 RepID=UPI0032B76982
MKHASVKVAFVLAAMFAGSYALAKPLSYELPDETAEFRPGPGVELAQSNCAACHSADYVSMQPPKKGDAFWLAEVKKMKNTYGAPIEDADIKGIADYLAATY